jgi:hypothetical protein
MSEQLDSNTDPRSLLEHSVAIETAEDVARLVEKENFVSVSVRLVKILHHGDASTTSS